MDYVENICKGQKVQISLDTGALRLHLDMSYDVKSEETQEMTVQELEKESDENKRRTIT